MRAASAAVWVTRVSDGAAVAGATVTVHDVDGNVLASGASDGHVAMLGPGAPRDGRTSVVPLAETTRRDNLRTFPEFESLDDVPTHGVTVGLQTIMDARALRLVIHGDDKRAAIERLLALDGYDPTWPVSIVHEHEDAEILIA